MEKMIGFQSLIIVICFGIINASILPEMQQQQQQQQLLERELGPLELMEPQQQHKIVKRSVFSIGNWCSGFDCGVVRAGYSSYTQGSHYSYHYLTLERLVDVPRYESGYRNLDDIVQVNRLEFCYTHNDLHAGQAICEYYGAGDVSYVYSSSNRAYRKNAGNGALNVQLAELVCPPSQRGISNCKVNILERSSCSRMRVRCKKHPSCWKPNNFVYSRKYNTYGQICQYTGSRSSSCHGQCFRCRAYQNHYSHKYHGHGCMSAFSQTYGQEIWEPHFRSFDGRHFDFQGQCSYYQVKLDGATIVGTYDVCGQQEVTCLKVLDIEIGKTALKLGQKKSFAIVVDGVQQNKAKPFCNEDLCFYEGSDLHDVVDMAVGIKVIWDRKSEANFVIDPENAGLLSGLFGDFDGNPDNDFRMPNGTQAEDEIEFGESWLVPGSCEKGRNASGLNPVITAKARAEAEIVCAVLKSSTFAECNKTSERDVIFENCVTDIATCSPSNNRSVCLCPSLEEYVETCAADGQIIPAWRDRVAECRDKCPAGQTFQTCGDSCTSSCKKIAATQVKCLKTCVEGCNCPEGMTKDNRGKCISIANCPALGG